MRTRRFRTRHENNPEADGEEVNRGGRGRPRRLRAAVRSDRLRRLQRALGARRSVVHHVPRREDGRRRTEPATATDPGGRRGRESRVAGVFHRGPAVKSALVATFQDFRRILGGWPCCGEVFRLTDLMIAYPANPAVTWLES